MNKKTKITLTLSAIALALGIGAQFYTNHKIDQVLQNFPYHLRDQLTLNVTQNASHFFSRDLTFSLSDENNTKTNIIRTKLTALPFAITADSELPAELVKELNKKLKITIDKNQINSKFSVIGDYLQSTITTQFRDVNNKSQQLEIDLNFASKTRFMEIQSKLSGFNYDRNLKVQGLKTQITLIPIGQNLYDLANLDLDVESADLFLLNGENTHFEFKNAQYQLDKSRTADTYDLATKFNTEKLYLSDKNNKDKSEVDQFQFSATQKGIPNELIFSDILRQLTKENANLHQINSQFLDFILNNNQLDLNVKAKNIYHPLEQQKTLKVKNIELNSGFNRISAESVSFQHHFTTDEIQYLEPNKETSVTLSGIKWDSEAEKSNLLAHLGLLQHISMTLAQKENPLASPITQEKIKKLKENYGEKNQVTLSLKSLNWDKNLELKGLSITNVEELEKPETSAENSAKNSTETSAKNSTKNSAESDSKHQQAYKADFSILWDNMILKQENAQFSNFKLHLPIYSGDAALILDYYYCELYSWACDPETQNTIANKLPFKIENGTLETEVDTFPTTAAGKITASTNVISEANKNIQKDELLAWEERYRNMKVNLDLNIAKNLLALDDKVFALKEKSQLWQWFHEQMLFNPYFVEEAQNYVLRLEHLGGGRDEIKLNGKSLLQLEQEHQQFLEQEMLKQEQKEQQEQNEQILQEQAPKTDSEIQQPAESKK